MLKMIYSCVCLILILSLTACGTQDQPTNENTLSEAEAVSSGSEGYSNENNDTSQPLSDENTVSEVSNTESTTKATISVTEKITSWRTNPDPAFKEHHPGKTLVYTAYFNGNTSIYAFAYNSTTFGSNTVGLSVLNLTSTDYQWILDEECICDALEKLRILDINNDGYMEVVVEGYAGNNLQLNIYQIANGQCIEIINEFGGKLKDYNGDGLMDIIASSRRFDEAQQSDNTVYYWDSSLGKYVERYNYTDFTLGKDSTPKGKYEPVNISKIAKNPTEYIASNVRISGTIIFINENGSFTKMLITNGTDLIAVEYLGQTNKLKADFVTIDGSVLGETNEYVFNGNQIIVPLVDGKTIR